MTCMSSDASSLYSLSLQCHWSRIGPSSCDDTASVGQRAMLPSNATIQRQVHPTPSPSNTQPLQRPAPPTPSPRDINNHLISVRRSLRSVFAAQQPRAQSQFASAPSPSIKADYKPTDASQLRNHQNWPNCSPIPRLSNRFHSVSVFAELDLQSVTNGAQKSRVPVRNAVITASRICRPAPATLQPCHGIGHGL